MRHFEILARYNMSFNDQLFRILDTAFSALPQPLLVQLNHVFVMDRIWLDRLQERSLVSRFAGPMDAVLFTNLDCWLPARKELDGEISRFVGAASCLEEEITFKTKAEDAWIGCRKDDALLHLFNHQSLHRGEILRILGDCHIPFGNSDLLPFVARRV